MKPMYFSFIILIALCTSIGKKTQSSTKISDLRSLKNLTLNYNRSRKFINCLTCTNSIIGVKNLHLNKKSVYKKRRKRHAYENSNINNQSAVQNTSFTDLKSLKRSKNHLENPHVINKSKLKVSESIQRHTSSKESKQHTHGSYLTVKDKDVHINEEQNVRNHGHINSTQSIPLEELQTMPSDSKTKEKEISIEKLKKLLAILNQQIDERQIGAKEEIPNNHSELITSTQNLTMVDKLTSGKRFSQVSKYLIVALSLLLTMALVCQFYATLLKYHEYKVFRQKSPLTDKISFLKFYFNLHRKEAEEKELMVESDLIGPKLVRNRKVLMDAVTESLDKIDLEDENKLQQMYSSPEHFEFLKRHLYYAT